MHSRDCEKALSWFTSVSQYLYWKLCVTCFSMLVLWRDGWKPGFWLQMLSVSQWAIVHGQSSQQTYNTILFTGTYMKASVKKFQQAGIYNLQVYLRNWWAVVVWLNNFMISHNMFVMWCDLWSSAQRVVSVTSRLLVLINTKWFPTCSCSLHYWWFYIVLWSLII